MWGRGSPAILPRKITRCPHRRSLVMQISGNDLPLERRCDAGANSGDAEIGGNGSSSNVSAMGTPFDNSRSFTALIAGFIKPSRQG